MKEATIESKVDALIGNFKGCGQKKKIRSRKILGVPVWMLLTILISGLVVTATLLDYYGKVTTTANVSQSVLLDGNDYTNPLTYEFDAIGGDCKWSCHWLNNTGRVDAPIGFDTSYNPDGERITTKYYTPTHYTFQTIIGDQSVAITVEDGDCHITWTIDFPMEAPYDPGECNGMLAVGLIIAQDGNDNGPSFQIHNNDGTNPTYPWGTWLYSPWGPTIDDGWFGWHSGSINIPLEDLSCQWAEATGERYHEDNPEGIFTITLAKCVLGADFHWALFTAIGDGFCNYNYQQAYYPADFNWADPMVDMSIPNYEPATIMTDLGAGFTLGKYQSKEIIICHSFDIAILPWTYIITSQFQPAS